MSAPHGYVGRFHAMGGPCELLVETTARARARALTEIVAAEAWRIEDKFSRYVHGNIVATINSANGKVVCVDPETAHLLDFAERLYELSDAAFDVTSGILRRAWRFDGSDAVPDPKPLKALLASIGWDKAIWRSPQLTLLPGMEIDLGGIGKEYAVDRAVRLLLEASNLPCLVNFGGDLAVTAGPRKREAWSVGLEPLDATMPPQQISLKQGALATSGDARRFLLKDGVRYGHVLDPRTGWPVAGAASSVTVAAATCTQAGMLATLALLKGAGAERFLALQTEKHWCRR